MPTIVPTDLSSCWTYEEPKTHKIIKACAVSGSSESVGMPTISKVKAGEVFIPSVGFVKKCNQKRDNRCNLNINDSFFKACDPKHDKKCNIDFSKLLTSSGSNSD